MGCGSSTAAKPSASQDDGMASAGQKEQRANSVKALTTAVVKQNVKQVGEVYDMRTMVELGRGGFGTVNVVKKMGTNDTYALKEMHGGDGDDGVLFEEMVSEINMQKSLDHPNIARIYDYFLPPEGNTTENSHMYIVMELCAGAAPERTRDAHRIERRLAEI